MSILTSLGLRIDRPKIEDASVNKDEFLDNQNYVLEDLMVRTTVRWKDGSETSKIINWSDRESVRGWARVARAALVAGGTTICQKEEN